VGETKGEGGGNGVGKRVKKAKREGG